MDKPSSAETRRRRNGTEVVVFNEDAIRGEEEELQQSGIPPGVQKACRCSRLSLSSTGCKEWVTGKLEQAADSLPVPRMVRPS